jgi:hypothetical protein
MRLARWTHIGVSIIGALAMTSCGPFAQRGVPQAAEDLVFVGTSEGLAAINPARGRVEFTAPHAVATPDWSRLFATSREGANRLGVLDGRTGAEQASLSLPERLVPRVVSTSGRRVALAVPRPVGPGQYAPGGRERTTIVVVDTSGKAEPKRLELPGNLEPEAFSADDQRLFVIDYLPPEAPDRYRVRQLDLATGAVRPVPGIKGLVPEEEMRGTGRMQVLAPDRPTLYTLYTHQPDHLHSRDLAQGRTTARGDVHAFVHILSLKEGWAFCLNLPTPFGIGPATAHALAVSPDGKYLYVVDRSSGAVAMADAQQRIVVRSTNVGAGTRADRGVAAQVGPDGTLYVAGGSELLAVNGRTLAVERRWPIAGTVTGLGVSSDSTRLYLGQDARMAVLDVQTGDELGTVSTPGIQAVKHVGRVEPLSSQS